MSEEPRSMLRGIFQGKTLNEGATSIPLFAIHPRASYRVLWLFPICLDKETE